MGWDGKDKFKFSSGGSERSWEQSRQWEQHVLRPRGQRTHGMVWKLQESKSQGECGWQ